MSASSDTKTEESPNTGLSATKSPYNIFLERLRRPSSAPIVASLQAFVHAFPKNVSKEEASTLLHLYLTKMETRCKEVEEFQGLSDDEMSVANECFERFLISKLYFDIFNKDAADREKDLILEKKIKRLQWLSFEHLDIPYLPTAESLSLAIESLTRISDCKSPRDKLVHIINCWRVVVSVLENAREMTSKEFISQQTAKVDDSQSPLTSTTNNSAECISRVSPNKSTELIQEDNSSPVRINYNEVEPQQNLIISSYDFENIDSETFVDRNTGSNESIVQRTGEKKAKTQKNQTPSGPISADEILPLLIYVVVKASPPELYSNVEFISAFRHPSRLVSEDMYCFTQFSSAVAFLLNLKNSSDLSISAEEFKILTEETEYGAFEDISADSHVLMTKNWYSSAEFDVQYTCHMIDNIAMTYEHMAEFSDLKIKDVSLLFSEYLKMCRALRHSRKLFSTMQSNTNTHEKI